MFDLPEGPIGAVTARQGNVTVSHGAQLGGAYCAELLSHSGRLIGGRLAPIVNRLNPPSRGPIRDRANNRGCPDRFQRPWLVAETSDKIQIFNFGC